MRLKLNGEDREIEGVSTVEELIQALGIHRWIVVEHNGNIIKRDRYATAQLQDGDVLEIVHMVGGG